MNIFPLIFEFRDIVLSEKFLFKYTIYESMDHDIAHNNTLMSVFFAVILEI